jgi:hypothetical protein
MTTERFSLKDHLFNAEKVAYLGGLLEPVVPDFDRDRFERQVVDAMPALELKQRIALIASVLGEHLATDFPAAAAQIRAALPPPLDPSLKDDDFGDFIFAPFGKYIEDNGTDDYDTAMGLLRDLTMRFSMEGSIRPFIEMRPEETLQQFETWARDPNYHVRRLVSESTRPRLPWAPRINLDPGAPMPLLDILHADGTRYVTRSVANHLKRGCPRVHVEPESWSDPVDRPIWTGSPRSPGESRPHGEWPHKAEPDQGLAPEVLLPPSPTERRKLGAACVLVAFRKVQHRRHRARPDT